MRGFEAGRYDHNVTGLDEPRGRSYEDALLRYNAVRGGGGPKNWVGLPVEKDYATVLVRVFAACEEQGDVVVGREVDQIRATPVVLQLGQQVVFVGSGNEASGHLKH